MKPYRIAIAGFQHETNTFAASRADIDEFLMADSWPCLLHGQAVIDDTLGMNLPIAGAIDKAASVQSVGLAPILWCAAEPSGYVTDEAYERITSQIIEGVKALGPLDAVYLDLHGAMVTQSFQDGEGELLQRLRSVVGPEMPIGVSLDLHANITRQMVEHASLITVYRTYPHLDMAKTGYRCMEHLLNALAGTKFCAAFRQASYLVPLHAQSTERTPCHDLYQMLEAIPDNSTEYLELAMGFTAADIYDCGPSVVAYAETTSRAEILVDKLSSHLEAAESEFDSELFEPDKAVELAMGAEPGSICLLADVQDNPGAGGTSDTTGILQALLTHKARHAVLGIVCDAAVAEQAHAIGEGGTCEVELGGKEGGRWGRPVRCRCRIRKLSSGTIDYTGEMYGGAVATLGSSCLLQTVGDADIQIVVSSQRIQCLDQALFTHFGVDLCSAKIIVVKSTVHYLADFEPLVSMMINVGSPGAFPCQLDDIAYRQLRPGVRLGPCGDSLPC